MNENLDKEATLQAPVEETVVGVVEEKSEGKFDKLTNREALEKAITEKREAPEEPKEAPRKEKAPSNKEIKEAVSIDPEAPSEFSAAGKKAWKEKDVTGIQKEFRRIHDSRTQEISRAQAEARQAKEEGKTYRELAKMAAPYIEARGQEGVTPEKAIMEALALINEFKKGDPQAVKSELKKIGIDLDKAPSQGTAAIPQELQEKIDAIQKNQDELIKEREALKFEKVVQTFETIFKTLTSEKTRTGETVFPDLLDESEEGKRFAQELGSLTQDQRFQAGVLRRFPQADLATVVREAYKYLGGKVSGEPVTVSPSNQKDIDKKRRAAASTPGRVMARSEASNLVGKLSNRAAIARALEERRER